MAWLEVDNYAYPGGWRSQDSATLSRDYCEKLESGRILYFPRPPFEPPDPAQLQFLTTFDRNDTAIHKNVSYRPSRDVVHGFSGAPETLDRLRAILRDYSQRATSFLRDFLAPYDGGFTLDYASFRSEEEEGRKLPLHKRNDLLHVDAFPSRPTHGARILRVFTNIHPSKPRVWTVGEQFPTVAGELAQGAGLARFAEKPGAGFWAGTLHALGAPIPARSAYDRFMLRLHDYMKEDSRYQEHCAKTRLEFPPMATWLTYTDGVPHAVLSGQYALEQTFIISRRALVAPKTSPISVLESLCGRPLTPAQSANA